ncbi:hypothetical protein, partial [Aquibacillus kalidii]|uniref:hypothetical protein n=1 Tax=Aquibacillus kalidii TaxID=2762597 RepID=UPI001C98F06E
RGEDPGRAVFALRKLRPCPRKAEYSAGTSSSSHSKGFNKVTGDFLSNMHLNNLQKEYENLINI